MWTCLNSHTHPSLVLILKKGGGYKYVRKGIWSEKEATTKRKLKYFNVYLPYFGLSNTRKIHVGLFGQKLTSHWWNPGKERKDTVLTHCKALLACLNIPP